MSRIIIPRKRQSQPQYPASLSDPWDAAINNAIRGYGCRNNNYISRGINSTGTHVITDGAITNPSSFNVQNHGVLNCLPVTLNGPFTFAFLLKIRVGTSDQNASTLAYGAIYSDQNRFTIDYAEEVNYTRVSVAWYIGYTQKINLYYDFTATQQLGLLVFDYDGVTLRIIFNGRVVASGTPTGSIGGLDTFGLLPPSTTFSVLPPIALAAYSQCFTDTSNLVYSPWQIFRKQAQVLYFDVGGGGAQTLTPSPGSTVVAGSAPTISQPQTVAPNAGDEVYAGQVPSITQSVSIAPVDGAVSFAGSAPTISQPQTVTPGVGAEVYAGQVPSITQPVSITPADGAVSFAGSAPTIGQPRTVVVGTAIARPDGTIDGTGFTPVGAATIHECLNEVTPNDSTYIVGTSDGVEVSLQDIADPAVSTGHVVRFRAKADSGWLSLVLVQGTTTIASKYYYGTFPSSWTDDVLTLTAGEADAITDYSNLRLRLSGLIGDVYYSWAEFSVAQATEVVTLGYVPTINQTVAIAPSTGAVSFAGSAPTISQPQTVAPGVGAEVYAGQALDVSQAASVRPDVGTVSFAGSAPTISQPQTITTVTGSALLAGFAPAVTQGVSVSPSAGSEVVLGYVPALIQGSGVQPVDGAVAVAGFAPTIGQPHTIVTVTGAYAILGTAPTVTQAAIISPDVGVVGIDGYVPALAQPRTITTVTGAVIWAGFAPGIGSPVEYAKYLAGVRVYHTDAGVVVKHTTSSTRITHN